MTPLVAAFSFISQAYSQTPIVSLSTTTGFSTLTAGTTTFAALTTSSYGTATGYIPGTFSAYEGPTVCFYVPYPFHVDSSTQRVVGTISGSSPFNFYIMSKSQYNYFVLASPPCGSSYVALKLDYAIRAFDVDWTAPSPGDYYIILENTSMYEIAYTIRIGSVQPSSTLVYSTATVIQTLTFIQQQEVNNTTTLSESAVAPAETNYTAPLAIAVVLGLVAIVVVVARSKKVR
jgi:hypothetical protein